MKVLLLLSLMAALCFSGPPAGANPRLHVEAMEYPWSAVGRLNMGGRAYCTGVLVSETIALTAAHCLWNQTSRAWWPASSVHFIAGYQGGEASLHSLAQYYVVADGWMPGKLEEDWAVIVLEQPLGRTAGWIGLGGKPDAGAPLGQLGYRAESAHAMSLDYGCRLISADPRFLWNDCEVAHGDSGGPLLSFLPDGPKMVGITIAAGHAGGKISTGTVAITALFDQKRYPNAAKLIAEIGHGPGHGPAIGSPVAPQPSATVAALDPGGKAPPSLATLAKLLAGTP